MKANRIMKNTFQSKQKQIKPTQYKVLFEKKYGNFEQAFNQLG